MNDALNRQGQADDSHFAIRETRNGGERVGVKFAKCELFVLDLSLKHRLGPHLAGFSDKKSSQNANLLMVWPPGLRGTIIYILNYAYR
jgi:hypothetical protein